MKENKFVEKVILCQVKQKYALVFHSHRQLRLLFLQRIQIYLAQGENLQTYVEYKINNELDIIRKLIISNKLTLNIGKTEYMIIGSKRRLDGISETSKIIYGDYQLKRIKEKKILALIIDDQLTVRLL